MVESYPLAHFPTAERDQALRHGYSLVSLSTLARRAVFESHWRFLTFHERYEIAWSAMAEALYASDDVPRPFDLVRVGEKAIRAHVDGVGHTWGIYIGGHHDIAPGSGMVRFEKFWWSQACATGSPEDHIVDATALRQIWPRLNGVHQMVLEALATHGDYERAAEALGKSYKTFVTQIYTARKQFLRLWHEGEEPSGVWGHDQRKRRPGSEPQHSITVTTIRRRARRAAKANQAATP